MSPNMMAPVEHAAAQAVTTSPSFRVLFSFLALSFPAWMRCTQKVHFSMTPRERTVTSGLRTILPRSVFIAVLTFANCLLSWYLNQLKRRTLYGQLFAQ